MCGWAAARDGPLILRREGRGVQWGAVYWSEHTEIYVQAAGLLAGFSHVPCRVKENWQGVMDAHGVVV